MASEVSGKANSISQGCQSDTGQQTSGPAHSSGSGRSGWCHGESVRGTSFDETARRWEALSDGATVVEPFAASAWSAGFGMLTDRFGVTWVVDVDAAA